MLLNRACCPQTLGALLGTVLSSLQASIFCHHSQLLTEKKEILPSLCGSATLILLSCSFEEILISSLSCFGKDFENIVVVFKSRVKKNNLAGVKE